MLANQIKIRAIKLRKKGFSLQEISQSLNIAKSTASLWLRKISLSEEAIKKLAQKEILGRSKAVSSKKQTREKQLQVIQKSVGAHKVIPFSAKKGIGINSLIKEITK